MAVTSFIPELWSARLLYALDKAHVATNVVNRDYEGDIKNAGDKVHINTIGAITVKDYTANSDIAAPDALSTSDQELEIDQAKYFNFQVDDVDAAQAAGNILDTAMERAAYSLTDAADAYILGVIAAGADANNKVGSTGSPIALTAANVYEYFVQLRLKLDKKSVPTQGRSIVVPPEVYATLLNDTTHFAAVSDAQADSAIINGLVGRIAGFDIYVSNNAVYDNDNSCWVVTAQVPEATTYAEQVIKTEAYRLQNRFADGVKGLHVYGAKVTRPEAVAVLYCTTSF